MLKQSQYPQGQTTLCDRLKFAVSLTRTKRDVALACGVTDQAVTGWIKSGRIKSAHMQIISTRCGVDLHWLISGAFQTALSATDPAAATDPAVQACVAHFAKLLPAQKLTAMSLMDGIVSRPALSLD